MAVAENLELTSMDNCAGSDAATGFEALVRRHERQVLGVALRLLGSREDARDVAQETFLRLHRHLGRFDEEAGVGAWLYRVTVNLCRDRWREVQRRREVDLGGIEDEPRSGADAEARLIESERLRQVRDGMMRLGNKERLALLLRDVEGLSTAEVARILGVKEITVRVQISQARLKLRELLKAGSRRLP